MEPSAARRHGAWPAVGPSYPGDIPRYGESSSARRGGRGGFGKRGHFTHSRPHTERGLSIEDGKTGRLCCGFVAEAEGSTSPSEPCTYRCNSVLALTLHKADRHLIYPPGGKQELDKMDPMLVEERKESEKRASRKKRSAEEDEETQILNTIPGLNIALSTPELIDQWIAERKKRWPTKAVVAKRLVEAWDDSSRGQLRGKQQGRGLPANGAQSAQGSSEGRPQQPAKNHEEESDSSDSDESGSESLSGGSSSESDAPSEEAIQRHAAGDSSQGLQEPHVAAATQNRPLKALPASGIPPHRRPRPRNPQQNPFEPRNLLHALLKQQIIQHVATVAQVIRFLLRNGFLQDVETQSGDAEDQRRRRNLVQDCSATSTSGTSSSLRGSVDVGAAVHYGALPTVRSEDAELPHARALFRPASPELRPLTSLSWPPEPDPMIFLDPLRRDDPKPLTNKQYEALCTDRQLRELLCPPGPYRSRGQLTTGLRRAFQTLDDLPSDDHRRSALELILGVSSQTPSHPHQLGPTFVQQKPGESRFIGEVELFKLGLRCGPDEQASIQEIAKRISEVTGGPEFDVEPLGWDHNRDEGVAFREEKRRRYWEKEADRRDALRKLGLDVD